MTKPVFAKSTRKGKKYMVRYKNKLIHFGELKPDGKGYQQYRDSTGLGLYSHLDHNDKERRKRYLARAKGIKDKNGNLTWKDKESANYYAVRYLW